MVGGCGCGCVRIEILFECLDIFRGVEQLSITNLHRPQQACPGDPNMAATEEKSANIFTSQTHRRWQGVRYWSVVSRFLEKKNEKGMTKNANKLWERYCHVYCLSVWVPARILLLCSLWSCNENVDKISSFELSIQTWFYIFINLGQCKYSNEHLGKNEVCQLHIAPYMGFTSLPYRHPPGPVVSRHCGGSWCQKGGWFRCRGGVVNSRSKPKTKQMIWAEKMRFGT